MTLLCQPTAARVQLLVEWGGAKKIYGRDYGWNVKGRSGWAGG